MIAAGFETRIWTHDHSIVALMESCLDCRVVFSQFILLIVSPLTGIDLVFNLFFVFAPRIEIFSATNFLRLPRVLHFHWPAAKKLSYSATSD